MFERRRESEARIVFSLLPKRSCVRSRPISPSLEIAFNRNVGRNLFILAGTLLLFSLISCGLAYTNIAREPGSPGDVSLWRTMGLILLVISLIVALSGVLSSLFEQAERRAEDQRRNRRNS